MPNDKIVIDLAHLAQIGEYHLPAVANLHLDAAEKLASVEFDAYSLFDSPMDTNSKSSAYAKWLELYTRCQEILAETVTTTSQIAEGIVAAAEAYAEQDLSNAEQLKFEKEMEAYEKGDSEYQESGGEHGDKGAGPPPPKPGTPPEPNETPDDPTKKKPFLDNRSPDDRVKNPNEGD